MTSRYRSPAKKAAYIYALNLAAAQEWLSAEAIIRQISSKYRLSHKDARDVAAKAVSVERGKRMKAEK